MLPKGGAAGKSGGNAVDGNGATGFKTRLCKYFSEGTCSRGPACTFAHGPGELAGGGGGPTGGGGLVGGGGGGQAGGGVGGYKSKLCTLFQENNCPHGAACSFAHGTEELKKFMFGCATVLKGCGKGYKTQLCKYFEAGQCNHGTACTYAHGSAELRPAPASGAGGGTPPPGPCGGGPPAPAKGAGGKSKSTNGKEGLGVDPQAAGNNGGSVPYKTLLCKFFKEQGTCSRGDACTFAHGVDEIQGFKTKVCKFFAETGSCTRGELCSFAHGPQELRSGADREFARGGAEKGGYASDGKNSYMDRSGGKGKGKGGDIYGKGDNYGKNDRGQFGVGMDKNMDMPPKGGKGQHMVTEKGMDLLSKGGRPGGLSGQFSMDNMDWNLGMDDPLDRGIPRVDLSMDRGMDPMDRMDRGMGGGIGGMSGCSGCMSGDMSGGMGGGMDLDRGMGSVSGIDRGIDRGDPSNWCPDQLVSRAVGVPTGGGNMGSGGMSGGGMGSGGHMGGGMSGNMDFRGPMQMGPLPGQQFSQMPMQQQQTQPRAPQPPMQMSQGMQQSEQGMPHQFQSQQGMGNFGQPSQQMGGFSQQSPGGLQQSPYASAPVRDPWATSPPAQMNQQGASDPFNSCAGGSRGMPGTAPRPMGHHQMAPGPPPRNTGNGQDQMVFNNFMSGLPGPPAPVQGAPDKGFNIFMSGLPGPPAPVQGAQQDKVFNNFMGGLPGPSAPVQGAPGSRGMGMPSTSPAPMGQMAPGPPPRSSNNGQQDHMANSNFSSNFMGGIPGTHFTGQYGNAGGQQQQQFMGMR